MNGFLNVFKPTGMSSAAVVGKIKRATGEKRIGHAGTLDPEASGVLPIMLGRATRLFDFLVDKVKIYDAVCEFGTSTDTQDATGNVTATGTDYPSIEEILQAKDKLQGDIWQRPSAFSAIKQNGKPLYQRARDGENVEVPLRMVHVDRIDVLGEKENHGVELSICCGKGTYIRSICNDLGEMLGCPAHMRSLCRTQSGFFTAENAITLEQALEFANDRVLQKYLIKMDEPLINLPSIEVPGDMFKLVSNGSKIPAASLPNADLLPENTPLKVYMCGKFWGVAQKTDGVLRWLVQIPPEE